MVMASTTVEAAARIRATAEPQTTTGTLSLDVRQVAMLLWLATVVILSLGILREVVVHMIGTGTALKDMRQLALDAEHSLPAWYESFLMLAASGLLGMLAALAPHNDSRNRLPWMLLAVIFLVMSIDEVVAFHEVSMAPLRDAFKLTGFLYFAWVVVAAPILLVLALYFIPFLLRLPRCTAVRFCIAGALFVGGAFGLEFVGGYYASSLGVESVAYKITASLEECLEITGMTLFVLSLLQHLATNQPSLRIAMKA